MNSNDSYSSMVTQLMTMILMSTITPIMAASASNILNYIDILVRFLYCWLLQRFGPKRYSVTIKHTMITSGTSIDYQEEDTVYNAKVIRAVLMHLQYNKHTFDNEICNMVRPDDSPRTNFLGMKAYLKAHKFLFIPTSQFTYRDMRITYTKDQSHHDNIRETKILLTIDSTISSQYIHDFINECYIQFVDRTYDVVIDTPYIYKQIPHPTEPQFKRYTLNSTMTFDKLFFPEKNKILNMIERLSSGQLQKLAIMLTGTPGCGKSSIIKAIAHKLGYCIIEVKLSLVKSDSALIDIFHNQIIIQKTINAEICDLVPINRRIYIFEDVDAESDIIHQRTKDTTTITQSSTTTLKLSDDKNTVLEKPPTLTLSGVLNTLDGILEMHGCVIVMTTNHIEKLDAAFYRPGRITMMLEMRKMRRIDALCLIHRKFDSAVIPDDALLDGELTAATLESYCQIAETQEELIELIAAARTM